MEQKRYRYEMHVHCSDVSDCGKSTAVEMVHAFAAAGYDGFVLTDHSVRGNCWMPREMPWAESIGYYRDAYLRAKEAGDAIGFTVLFGWEHHYAYGRWEERYGHGKEVLTYGITPEFLIAHPEIGDCSLEEYVALVHSVGGLVVHAHPYRARSYLNTSIPPVLAGLDGVEIYNASNTAEENLPTYHQAKNLGLTMVSGSDSHRIDQNIGLSGLVFDRPIFSNDELVAALRAKIGRPIIGGKIAETDDVIVPMIAEA